MTLADKTVEWMIAGKTAKQANKQPLPTAERLDWQSGDDDDDDGEVVQARRHLQFQFRYQESSLLRLLSAPPARSSPARLLQFYKKKREKRSTEE